MIGLLTNKEVQEFLRDHSNDDPLKIALNADKYPNLPIQLISQQIQSRNKAKKKIPDFAQCEGLIYPPSISLEQCSSQITAAYKARLINGAIIADLTGGFGVDTYFFSKKFQQVHYVERDEGLCEIMEHNSFVLDAKNIKVLNQTAESFLENAQDNIDVVYIDPARRGKVNQKLFKLTDCEPDVLKMKALLVKKASRILLKTSPMLDIEEAINLLEWVSEVHVVSVENECKEVLYLLSSKDLNEGVSIVCVNFKRNGDQFFTYKKVEEQNMEVSYTEVQRYLYEPNASILKAGAFKVVTRSFNLSKLHVNSHLYTSNELYDDFPGRAFEVVAVVPYNKKEVNRFLEEGKANIASRNFPYSVQEIFKKLGVKEGGSKYLFATTDLNQKLKIAITEKVY